MEFRELEANEIDCRVNTINEKGLTLLLYKDARVDMNILDETVGSMNWQRDHKELKGNIYCGISIWDTEKQQWVTKWDCGKESFSDSEKGEASDSFKRAGFNVGIGRELYTAPFIWVSKENYTPVQKDDKKWSTYDTFRVKQIRYNKDREIDGLVIVNTKTNKVVFEYGNMISADAIEDMPIQEAQKQRVKELDKQLIKSYLDELGKAKISELTYGEANKLLERGK